MRLQILRNGSCTMILLFPNKAHSVRSWTWHHDLSRLVRRTFGRPTIPPLASSHYRLTSVVTWFLNCTQDTPYMLFYREDGAPDAEHQPTISVSLKARIEADNRLAQKDNEGRERKRKSNELAKALPNNNNTNRRDDEPPPGGPSFTPNYIS